jgi:hypothetical protein
VDWLSFPREVLTLKFQSELGGVELGLVIRLTDTGTDIIHMDMDTTGRIRTMAITRVPRTTGPVGAGFITATTVIITTGTGTKLA